MITPVMIAATGVVTKGLKKTLEVITGKCSTDSLQKTAIMGNNTHNMEGTAAWNLKPERWGSPLVQEKGQGEKACDKRKLNNTTTTTTTTNNNNNNNNNNESTKLRDYKRQPYGALHTYCGKC
jgi:hypothetical protein